MEEGISDVACQLASVDLSTWAEPNQTLGESSSTSSAFPRPRLSWQPYRKSTGVGQQQVEPMP
jgi:hypothetical protein